MSIQPGIFCRCHLKRWLCAVVGLIVLVGCGGCAPKAKPKAPMPKRVAAAVEEARARKVFWRSPLADVALSADEAKAAESYVRKNPDVSSYHLLMALRRHAPNRYADVPDATKAKILCDAMARLVLFNDFGYVGELPDDACENESGKALVMTGRAALPLLEKLLADRSEAPLGGSEDSTISVLNRYRRADFAYRYIMLILGRKPAFHGLPAERDKLIAELQKELRAKR